MNLVTEDKRLTYFTHALLTHWPLLLAAFLIIWIAAWIFETKNWPEEN